MNQPSVFSDLMDAKVADLIRNGAVGVIPTDTVYGLVCAAGIESAVERLYALKSRDKKPGTIIAASVQQLADLGIKLRYLKAVEHFWPNSISIIIALQGLEYIQQGVGSIEVRIPSNDGIRSFLENTGPLMTSSANHPGKPPANTIEDAQKYFEAQVDFYVDGGDLTGRESSTIIRVVDDAIEIIREGAVKITEEGRILPS